MILWKEIIIRINKKVLDFGNNAIEINELRLIKAAVIEMR
jgi:hypothetical protein